MRLFNINWSQTGKALRNDAKIWLSNTDGHSAANPKAILIGTGVAVIGGAILLSITKTPSASSTTPAQNASLVTPALSAAALYDFRTPSTQNANVNNALRLTLKSGQSLGPLLQKNGVTPNTAYDVTQAFAKVYKPKNLRAGQKINLYFDQDGTTFSGLTLKPNTQNTVFVTRKSDGNYAAKNIEAEFQKELVTVNSQIENSLYLDAGKLGAPDKVIVQFSQIYAHSVDFQRDIRAGDKFEMMFEVFRDHQGNTIKAGDLVYTSFSPRGKTSSYYLFTKSNGNEGYYDQKGKGAKRMLMRTPINGARLSSRYGRRRHPIKGYMKKHSGVDFAAPRGTPIFAAGTGTITRAGRYGGYGNYIQIRHSDGYATAYGHMSKFARGSKRGRRVVQGQTIGYVGTTGLSTGNHLHYEVHRHGKRINPMSLSTLSGKPLKKSEVPAFKIRAAEIDKLRDSVSPALTPKPELLAELITAPSDYVTLP